MIEFRIGDVRRLLAELPAGSVDLIATSWPYLAQRDYLPKDHPMKAFEIGQESTPAEFIATLLEVTAEFRRVLAPHGSVATELGDGFSGSGGGGGDYLPGGLREGQPAFTGSGRRASEQEDRDANAAHWRRKASRRDEWPLERSLVMAPELYRVALAYGVHPLTGQPSPAGRWRVRNVVVHGRPNPPVGALGGKYRPACSYWAVACTGRRWFDLDAVRVEPKDFGPRYSPLVRRDVPGRTPQVTNPLGPNGERIQSNPAGAPPLDWFEDEGDQFERDLWTLPTSPYPGSHYATFSPELIRRFIVSMCPPRVCRECGKPSVRLTKRTERYAAARAAIGDFNTHRGPNDRGTGNNGSSRAVQLGKMTSAEHITLGWSDCGHDAWRPGIVLDPFGGSGTTGMVAAGNGRDCILFDLDERCEALARERIGLYLEEQARPQPEPPAPDHEQEAML